MITIYQLASAFHEDWRKTRLRGAFEPRWKKIKDNSFVERLDENNLPANVRKTDNGFEIDIANSSYGQLSRDWCEENFEAATVVMRILISDKKYTLDEVGSIIHDAWLERNEWAKGGELDVPFEKLPKEEQDKDLRQYEIALKLEQERKTALQASITEWKNRGYEVVYPQRKDEWDKCVEARADDLYDGREVAQALDVMEALENGAAVEEANKIAEKGSSGASWSMLMNIVVKFSKRGPEFYRATARVIPPESERYLQQIENENSVFKMAEKMKNRGLDE